MRTPRLNLMVVVVAAVYIAVGVGFAPYTRWTNPQHTTWRLTSWLICALAYAVQIRYQQWRVRSSPVVTATNCAIAGALGGLGLGIAIGKMKAALAFPFVVGIPAFILALAIAAFFTMLRHAR